MQSPIALPNVVAVLRPHVEALAPEARPAFMARLERGSAARYRKWAGEQAHPVLAAALRVCAAREDAIADIVEASYPLPAAASAAVDAALAAAGNALRELHRDRGFEELVAIQAHTERGGAGAWRELAEHADAPEARILEVCARLEEESAEFLESTRPNA